MPKPTSTAVFVDQTSIHGLREFVQADGVKKTVWGLILISACGFFCFEMYLLGVDCITEKTVASTSRFEPRKFPPLVYCPIGWIDPFKASAFGLEERHFKHIHGFLIEEPRHLHPWLRMEPNATAREDVLQVIRLHFNNSLDDLAYGISYDVEDVISKVQTYPVLTIEKHMATKGMCYVVRQTIDHLSMVETQDMYLIIHALDTGVQLMEEMLNSWIMKNMLAVGEPLRDLSTSTGLGRGKSSDIFLSWSSFEDIPLRRMPCTTEETDRRLCLGSCLSRVFAEHGWCEFYMPRGTIELGRLCTWTDILNHSFTKISEMTTQDESDTAKMTFDDLASCKTECPKPCSYKIYDLTMNEGQLNSQNWTMVTVRHQNTIIERVESLTCNWVSLVANVGGILGLVCGASLLSFAHLCAFLCSSSNSKPKYTY